METTTAVFLVSIVVASVIVYAIRATTSAADKDRAVRHEEAKAKLPLDHQEQMARIAAQRDSEIAKATGKNTPATIDATATRAIEG